MSYIELDTCLILKGCRFLVTALSSDSNHGRAVLQDEIVFDPVLESVISLLGTSGFSTKVNIYCEDFGNFRGIMDYMLCKGISCYGPFPKDCVPEKLTVFNARLKNIMLELRASNIDTPTPRILSEALMIYNSPQWQADNSYFEKLMSPSLCREIAERKRLEMINPRFKQPKEVRVGDIVKLLWPKKGQPETTVICDELANPTLCMVTEIIDKEFAKVLYLQSGTHYEKKRLFMDKSDLVRIHFVAIIKLK